MSGFLAAWVFWSGAGSFEREGNARDSADVLMVETIADFKGQVQQWKDLLLRGSDADARRLYWENFETLEREADEQALALQKAYPDPAVVDAIGQFLQAHRQAGLVYREGLRVYEASGRDARAADAVAKGVDRYPMQLLVRVQEEVSRASKRFLLDVGIHLRQEILAAVGVLLASLIAAAIAAAWVIQAWVVRPARELIQHLDRVATGDLSVMIPAASSDEIGQIAHRVDRIRRTLNQVIKHAELTAGRDP